MPRARSLAGAAAIFVVLAALVHMRFLDGFDRSVAVAIFGLASPALGGAGGALSILFSAEVSLLLGLSAAAYLYWQRGLGVWSLLPLTFVVLVGFEFLMKQAINQPAVPEEFHRSVGYPLATVKLAGSFPSGHAIRTAFFCTLLFTIVRDCRPVVRRGLFWVLIAVLGLSAFTRVYLGAHWLSDVIGGLLLGGAVGCLTARAIHARLTCVRTRLASCTQPVK